jgi:hypothetical protein
MYAAGFETGGRSQEPRNTGGLQKPEKPEQIVLWSLRIAWPCQQPKP